MEATDRVLLPVGLEVEGKRYRTVVIDEKCGLDDENVAAPRIRNNGARAVSQVLRRCIQEIPGVLPRKKDPYSLIKPRFVQDMYTVDRDFLFLSVQLLSMDESFTQESPCPACGEAQEQLVEIAALDVYEWEEGQDACLELELPVGVPDGEGTMHKSLVWKFPTGHLQERLAALPKHQVPTTMMAACTERLGSLDGLDTEAARRMRNRDRAYLLNAVRHQMPGVDLRLDMFCDNCKHEWDGDVDLTRFFRSESAATRQTTTAGRKKRKRGKRGSAK
jgi:hypothetical protein